MTPCPSPTRRSSVTRSSRSHRTGRRVFGSKTSPPISGSLSRVWKTGSPRPPETEATSPVRAAINSGLQPQRTSSLQRCRSHKPCLRRLFAAERIMCSKPDVPAGTGSSPWRGVPSHIETRPGRSVRTDLPSASQENFPPRSTTRRAVAVLRLMPVALCSETGELGGCLLMSVDVG